MRKKFSLLIIVLMLFSCTACGNSNYITDKKDQPIKNETTGQAVRNDIFCKPTDKDLVNVYRKYEKQLPSKKLSKLPDCNKFKITSGKYNGLWETIFVKPLAWLIIKLGMLLKNYGVSVMIIGAAIRLIMLPFSKKSLMTSENMKKAQPEIQRIERKYKDKTDNESMMAKSQETMMVYKKYNISPMSGCLVSFIQLPLFFAFLEAINRVPAIFEGTFLGLHLGSNALIGITTGSIPEKIGYIVIILLIMLTTYLSFKNNMASAGNDEATKQMQMMSKFMIIMISVVSITLPIAIALYWIVTNGIMAFQNIIIRKNLDKPKNNKNKDAKNVKYRSKKA